MWCITSIDLWILKNPCIPGIKPTWSWCIIFLICCWILFSRILLSIFHLYSSVILACSFLFLWHLVWKPTILKCTIKWQWTYSQCCTAIYFLNIFITPKDIPYPLSSHSPSVVFKEKTTTTLNMFAKPSKFMAPIPVILVLTVFIHKSLFCALEFATSSFSPYYHFRCISLCSPLFISQTTHPFGSFLECPDQVLYSGSLSKLGYRLTATEIIQLACSSLDSDLEKPMLKPVLIATHLFWPFTSIYNYI